MRTAHKLLLFMILALFLAGTLASCDSDTDGEPAECSTDTDCTPAACQVASCNLETGMCVFEDEICSDDDPCTDDSCNPDDGECVFTAKTCDDGDACTTDSCDADAGGCVFEAVECDDGDNCTTDSCNPATGECAFEAVECDDDNACTTDACDDDTGECNFTNVADGTACDDGDETTQDDVCTAGVCAGTVPVTPEPAMYRVRSVSLVAPTVSLNDLEMNDVIDTLLQAELDRDNWDLLTFFAPLALGSDEASTLTFGEGSCAYTDGAADECGFGIEDTTALFENLDYATEGTCSVDDGDTVDAPCYQTPTADFDLAALLPEHFSNTGLPAIEGYAVGAFGETNSELEGFVVGFLPKDLAESFTLEVETDDGPLTLSDLVSELDLVEHEGVQGWWVTVRYEAEKVDIAPAPLPDPEPTMYRVWSASITAPAISLNDVEMNEVIDTVIEGKLAEQSWDMLTFFDPLGFGSDEASTVTFGEGRCSYTDGEADDCGFEDGDRTADFENLVYATEDTCSVDDGPAVDAPCYATPTASFDLAALLPDYFSDTGLPSVEGYAVGGFGETCSELEGSVVGFVPKDLAESFALEIELDDGPLTLSDLVSELDLVEHDGVQGWWVTVAYKAEKVEITPAATTED